MSSPKRRRGFIVLLVGLVLGVGLLGFSGYVATATDQRPFCGQCHSMMPTAVTHKLSTHTNLACNDCHLPKNFVYHYSYKAYIGLYDIITENFVDYDLPIHVSPMMKDIINTNCKLCHTTTNMDVASMEAKRYCTDCHRNIPHNRTMPISTRMVAYE